ncbi:hypothetical protein E2320_022616, partial [Naja naja]
DGCDTRREVAAPRLLEIKMSSCDFSCKRRNDAGKCLVCRYGQVSSVTVCINSHRSGMDLPLPSSLQVFATGHIQAGTQSSITCEHGDRSYLVIHWYQQELYSGQTGLQLIGLSIQGNSPQMENKIYNIYRPDVIDASLRIPPDEATKLAKYFCVVSKAQRELQYHNCFQDGMKIRAMLHLT